VPRKNIPNSPATMSSWTALAPATFGERKMRSGTSGLAARDWRSTNPASSATDTAPSPRVCSEAQP
jgi:hypothetical protein